MTSIGIMSPPNGLPRYAGEQGDKIAGVDSFLKGPDQTGIGLKIEISHVPIPIVLLSKFQQGIGLPACLAPCRISGLR